MNCPPSPKKNLTKKLSVYDVDRPPSPGKVNPSSPIKTQEKKEKGNTLFNLINNIIIFK